MVSSRKDAPYNACDYWCERCSYREECKVYLKILARRTQHLLNGEDLDSWETILQDLHEDFAETLAMASEMAEQQGIDLEKLEDEPEPQSEVWEESLLYQLAHQFTLDAHNFLKLYWEDEFLQERFSEQVEELSWYHTLVSVKLARALSGLADGDDFDLKDATNSAQVALMRLLGADELLHFNLN